jgi:hypothetical protein
VGGQCHAPAAFPRERPSTHFTRGWMDPRAGLDGCGKSQPPPEFDLRAVQPIANCNDALYLHKPVRIPLCLMGISFFVSAFFYLRPIFQEHDYDVKRGVGVILSIDSVVK